MNFLTKNKVINFWCNNLSPHMHDFFVKLNDFGYNLKVNHFEDVREERINEGWSSDITHSFYNKVDLSSLHFSVEEIHVVCGLRGFVWIPKILNKFKKENLQFFVIAEAVDVRAHYIVKYFVYLMVFLKYGAHISKLFVIGDSSFYKKFIDVNKIIPFGYFINPQSVPKDSFDNNDFKRVIIISRLVSLKNIDFIINYLPDKGYIVDIFGDGPQKNKLLLSLKRRRFKYNVINFKGSVSRCELLKLLKNYDIGILASKYDGWGVAVNEYILSGLPVIVSSSCGSSNFICENIGIVFDPYSHISFHSALNKINNIKPLSSEFISASKRFLPSNGVSIFLNGVFHE